jgi:hypothetical protein
MGCVPASVFLSTLLVAVPIYVYNGLNFLLLLLPITDLEFLCLQFGNK